MKGFKLACVLAATLACMGCRASTPSKTPGGAKAGKHVEAVPLNQLPGVVTGVWYPDDADGVAKCERYRVLSPVRSGHDHVDVVPVGSLVITPNLIHAVTEYGEGNFYAVDRIDAEDAGVWRVTTRLGIDSMPDEPSSEDSAVSRLSLRGGKLRWHPAGQLETYSPTYARCNTASDTGGQSP